MIHICHDDKSRKVTSSSRGRSFKDSFINADVLIIIAFLFEGVDALSSTITCTSGYKC